MRELAATIRRWQREGESMALATLVRVRGSSPRLPGARLVLTSSGRIAGSVSAGCVENDVIRRATEVLGGGDPGPATYGIPGDTGLEVGLSCGGEIDVFIERFSDDPVWQLLFEDLESRRPAVFALAFEPAALAGRHMLMRADRPSVGSIAADLDEGLVDEAESLFASGGTRSFVTRCDRGEVGVFLQAFVAPPELILVGATHVAEPLCRLAAELGFDVTVVDPRAAFASEERFPAARRIVQGWPETALPELTLRESTYLVTLTHDPRFDLPALRLGLRAPVAYLGAMGSRRTHAKRLDTLGREGFTSEELSRIHGPVGLDLGAKTPEETAVAIIAEILAVRSGRAAGTLASGSGPIHGER